MTEYIIMVALIAIGAIGVFTGSGDVVRGQVGAMAQELAGQDATTANASAGAGVASGAAGAKTLENYTESAAAE